MKWFSITPGISIRTKLMVLLSSMAMLGLATVAAIAVDTAQSASHTAQSLSGRMLRDQAEETLINITISSAKENDLILQRVSRDAEKIAAYAAEIFSDPDDFHNPVYWSIWEHMRTGPDGQFVNGAEDTSSVFVPFTTEITPEVIRDIEISAYLDLILKPTLASNPNVEAIYFATPRDVVRYYPNVNLGAVLPADFRATRRVWYAGTMEKGAIRRDAWWTPAYLDATGLGVVTTAAAPARDSQGEIIGVVGIDVTLTEMKSSIEGQEFLPGGYSFLIDDSGRALALPAQGYLDMLGRSPEPDEFGTDLTNSNATFKPVIKAMLAGETGFKTIRVGDKELFVAFSPVQSAKWSLASVVEVGQVLQSLHTLNQDMESSTRSLLFTRILPVSGIIYGLVILLGLIITNQILNPIRKLASAAEEIGSGNWEVNLPENQHDEIGVLARAFGGMTRQLHDLVSQLEGRVADRTKELERRAGQLQAAADVGHAAASLRDLEELLNQVTHLISERFNFYHVGIFLLDDAQEYAVLKAANSQGGQQMLANGHKLRAGQQGIVGYVAGTQKPRIALDVGEDAVHFQNPSLPHTRSEMALPLVASEELLGVIDAQSEIESAFSPEDIEVLQVLADQVAVAIHNARLFQELQNNLRETENLYKLYSREAWSKISAQRRTVAFAYDRVQVSQADKKHLSSQAIEQLNRGQLVISDKNKNGGPRSEPYIIAPIMVHGQAIGFVQFERQDPALNWTDEEITLLKTLTGQVALTLENSRLLEEAQLKAEQERLVGEITTRIRASNDRDQILQTALDELRLAFPSDQIKVRFRSNDANELLSSVET